MTSPTPIEDLLREMLARLYRQEVRTAALEAALLGTPPTGLARPSGPLTQTPNPGAAETVVHPWPKRVAPEEREPRLPKPGPTVPAVSPLAVLESLGDVVWSVSPDGQLVFFAGGGVEQLYGVTAHELHGARGRWLDAMPPDDRDRMRTALARLPDTDSFTLEHRIAHASGTHRWAMTRGKLVRDRDGRPLRIDGITTDVARQASPPRAAELAGGREPDDRRELESRLAAAEERLKAAEAMIRGAANLATAGRMAAGVAHDFHNLLGVIVGNADLIREGLPQDSPHRETANAIASAAHTVAGVSRKLLAVGKPGPAQAGPLDVTAALRALEPVLRRVMGRALTLECDFAPSLPLIRADATQFDRVVLNLVLNARDAVAKGGTVTVRAALAQVEPGRAGWPADRAPGRYVAVTVADTGCGMPAEVRAKMFEAFFTTKGDRGTGLGLATVREAVAAAKGHVEVESEAGWGTQVRVYWPTLGERGA